VGVISHTTNRIKFDIKSCELWNETKLVSKNRIGLVENLPPGGTWRYVSCQLGSTAIGGSAEAIRFVTFGSCAHGRIDPDGCAGQSYSSEERIKWTRVCGSGSVRMNELRLNWTPQSNEMRTVNIPWTVTLQQISEAPTKNQRRKEMMTLFFF